MALDKLAGSAGINPTQGLDGLKGGAGATSVGKPGSLEFRKALEQFGPLSGAMPQVATGTAGAQGLKATGGADALKFSNHAVERMRSRGISFPPEEMKSIESAVTKAAAKGAKDTLILSGDNALIVSVKNHTVVTVMDRAAMKENVFTNIDSTVVI